jgi:hypothetical protein
MGSMIEVVILGEQTPAITEMARLNSKEDGETPFHSAMIFNEKNGCLSMI